LIANQLPSMLPLKHIQRVTPDLLVKLIQVHRINIHIFLDEKKQPKKMETKHKREKQKLTEESTLRRFLKKQILPSSFSGNCSHCRSSTTEGSIIIPDAYTFLREFPLPTLKFDEIYQTFKLWAQNDNGIMVDCNG